MTSYVVAGYTLVFGVLGLYAWRVVLRTRSVAARLLEQEPPPPSNAPGAEVGS